LACAVRKAKRRSAICSSHVGKPLAHAVAQNFSVDGFAFELPLRGFHYRTHLLHRIRAGFRNRVVDGLRHFGIARARGQVRFNDGDFFCFLVGEIGAAAFGELLHRFAPLLQKRLQHLKNFGVFERAHFFHFSELQRGFHHAKRAEAKHVFFSHRRDDIFLDLFAQRHASASG
jgi:hypothetical protein